MFKYIFNKLKHDNSGVVTEFAIAILLALYGVVCCTMFISENASSAAGGAEAFVEWVQVHHQGLVERTQELAEYGYCHDDLYSFLVDKYYMAEFMLAVHDFLSSQGEFTSEGYNYVPPLTGANLCESDMLDYICGIVLADSHYSAAPADTVRATAQSILRDFNKPWSRWYNRPYLTIVQLNDSGQICLDFCSDQYFNYTASGNPPYIYRGADLTFGIKFDGSRGGGYTKLYCDNYHFLGQALYDQNAAVGGADSLSLGYSTSGRSWAGNPSGYGESYVDEHGGSTITHYIDGSTNVRDGLNVDLPASVDGNGTTTIDQTGARGLTLDDATSKPAADTYPDTGTASDVAGNTSFMSKILDFLRDFWAGFVNGIVSGLRRFFLPSSGTVDLAISTIRSAFVSKFGFVSFDFTGMLGNGREPQNVDMLGYPLGNADVGGTVANFYWLIYAVDHFRNTIRGLVTFMLLIFNFDQLFHFFGLGGLALGARERFEEYKRQDKGG